MNPTPLSQPQPQISASHSASVYRRIATLFIALTAGVMLLAAYVIFARAEVVVLSEQREVKSDFIVDVSRTPGDGEVKGEVFEVSETVTQSFPSVSLAGIDQPAEGKVKISSRLGRAQTLVATTRLLTKDNILFRIRETVVVPANGSVTVAAFATEAGTKGEVADGTTFTIPGLNPEMQKFFTTTASGPFVGGKKEIRMVAQPDIDKAAQVLRDKAVEAVTVRLRATAAEGGAPVDGELIVVTDTSRVTDAVVGADVPEFSMTVTVKVTGVFYDKAAFDAEVRRKLGEKLMEGRALVSVDEESLTKELEKRDIVAGRANIGVSAKGMSILSPRSPGLETSKLTGVTVDAAKAYLESVDGVASASITAKPFWTKRMPNVADNITVEVR